jgi:O-antigen/teichoic acid export membrane protein
MRIRTRSLVIMSTQTLQQAITILLPIVLARMVSKQMLGSYRQVFMVYGLCAGLLSYQLGNSLYYFLPRVPLERRRTLLAQVFLGTLTRACLVFTILLIAAGPIAVAFNNPGLVMPLRLIGLYALGDSLGELIPAFMVSLDRPVRAGVYTVSAAACRIAAIIVTFRVTGSLPAVICALVTVQITAMLLGCLDMVRLSPGGAWRLDRALMREQWDYSWPLWPMVAVGVINLQFDKLVISRFFDAATYAVYSCGAAELPVIALVTQSINTAIMPNLVALVKEGRAREALTTWQEATRKASFVIFPCFVFFFIVAQDFMILAYGRGYAAAAAPFRIYLLMLPLKVAVYGTLFRAFGQTKAIALASVMMLSVNCCLSLPLTMLAKGTSFAFIAPSIAQVTAAILGMLYFIWRLRGLVDVRAAGVMLWRDLGQVLGVCALAALAIWLLPLPVMPLPVRLAVQASLFAVAFGLLVLGTGILKSDERAMVSWCLSRITGGALRPAKTCMPQAQIEHSVERLDPGSEKTPSAPAIPQVDADLITDVR